MFGRILIAVDHSNRAQWAAEAGCGMARGMHAGAVGLVHVAQTELAYAAEVAYVDPGAFETAKERGRELLSKTRRRFAEGLACEEMLRTGDPAAEIVRAAGDFRATLVVLGTHARSRFSNFLLGSTAIDVLHKAACPVLMVRHAVDGESVGVNVEVAGAEGNAAALSI